MERLFFIIQFVTVTVFFIVGAVLYRMGASDMLLDKRQYDAIQTSFVMDEPAATPPQKEEEKPKPPPERKTEETVPVPIVKETVEKEPDPEPEPEPPKVETPADEPPPQDEPPKPRQVYGLRRVYAQGLGADGGGSDAIVGRRGNTLNKAFDTLTATDADIRGRPRQETKPPAPPTVSAATVTQSPRLRPGFRNRRPQYSKEMLQHRVEGVVRARILIGADGMVKQVEIQSDIGYDSAEITEQFLMTLQFEPAMRGDESVSVWIPFSLRFELI